MPIDPSIILGIRPPQPIQTPDPLENYGRIMGVQNAMQQSQLGKLQLSQAEKQAREDEAYGEAFKAAGGSYEKLLPELASRGLGKQYLDVQGKILGNRKTESEIGKNTADADLTKQKVVGEAVARGRDQLATINTPQGAAAWTQAQFNDPVMGPILKAQGATPEQKLAEIPTDPAKFQDWKNTHILGAEKLVAHLDEVRKQVETERNNKEQNRSSMISAGAAASNAATTRDRLLFDKSQPKGQFDSERGIIVDPRTGQATPVTQGGAPIGPKDKDLNEGQGKAAGFGRRALIADDTLKALEKSGTTSGGRIQQAAESTPVVGGVTGAIMNAAPVWAGGPSMAQQKYQQAKREFIAAALRVESGATIAPSEFADADKRYFPQVGDSPEVIAQKQAARQAELESFKIQAGTRGSAQMKLPNAGKIGGILTANPDGSFNYGSP